MIASVVRGGGCKGSVCDYSKLMHVQKCNKIDEAYCNVDSIANVWSYPQRSEFHPSKPHYIIIANFHTTAIDDIGYLACAAYKPLSYSLKADFLTSLQQTVNYLVLCWKQ